MVNPDSDVYRLHPEWVYHFPSRPRSEARRQFVLNVGREDVQLWLLNSLNRLLDDYAISFIKWDMNRSMSREGGLTAVTYVDSDQKEAVVFAFRQSDAFGIPPAPLRLQGLTHDAYYCVKSEQLSSRCYSGAYHMQRGLEMPLRKGAYASCVVRVMLSQSTYQGGS